ncbi:MAG TPA: hypothetical protein VHD55_02550 [Candidatus Paceibacterota bacterium]|nr:hypothetical protein [Candidatus Paceibacterota bacterium]
MAREEKGGVEGLKRRLYTRKPAPKTGDARTPLSPSETHIPTSWSEIHAPGEGAEPAMPEEPAAPAAPITSIAPAGLEMSRKRMTFATKFFLGSIAFFVVAAGIAAALFLGGVNTTSPQNISISIDAPSLIDGGKEAQFNITITNRNTTSLNEADLVIDYPDGARAVNDPTQALTHERISIGTIKSGEQIKRTASALLYGQEGAQQKLVARLEYNLSGSNAVFEKSAETSFTIGSAPVSLTVDAPERVIAGDQFAMDITVRSNAAAPVNNVTVEAQYPFGYSVAAATPSAAAGGSLWRLGTLAPGASKKIHITGAITASDGDDRVFKFLIGSNADQTDVHVRVPFLTLPQTISVERPFISGSVSVEGKTGQSISVAAGKTLRGTVEWENNLDDSISDLELSLSFSGPALDKSSVNAQNGFYQSGNSTIIWTKDRSGELESVAPGATGSYQFSFGTLPPGSSGTLITNPTVTLNLTVRAVRQGSSGSPETITSAATAKVTLASQLSIGAESSHSGGPFQNGGPVPPRAETPTSYTITWTVKNSANAVANAVASAVLPPYVTFVTAQSGSGITYDSGSRTVRWNLGDVKAGVGYTTAARQAAFQVTLTPSASQVDSVPALTGPASITGQDRFAQVTVEGQAESVSTHTSDGGSGNDVVQPK